MVALFSPPQCPSREYRGVLRELRQEDADAAARLSLAINPHRVETGERVWQRATTPRTRDWVVDEDGPLAGHPYPHPGPAGAGRWGIGGHRDRRGRGLGAELYGAATAHLGEAPRLRTWVDGDPA